MGPRIRKFLCNRNGHPWDYGKEVTNIRICTRCSRVEEGVIVSIDGKMEVEWQFKTNQIKNK